MPFPKVNVPKEIGDLRPIALTPLPGKLIERFTHKQLVAYLDENNIITQFQDGFRKVTQHLILFSDTLLTFKSIRIRSLI